MTLASLAIGFGATDYTRRRGENTSTIRARVHPVAPQEMQRLPQGLAERVTWCIWTTADLRTVDEDSATGPDLIDVDGDWYQVAGAMPRREGGFTKAYLEPVHDRSRSDGPSAPLVGLRNAY